MRFRRHPSRSHPFASQRLLALACALPLSLAAACGGAGGTSTTAPSPKGPPGETLATIGSTKITVEELQKKLDGQSPFVRARYAAPERLKEFVEGQVRFEVLASEARARGYDKDPEVEEAIKKIIVQRLTREEFDGQVQLKDITDDDLRIYFASHEADYQKPEMIRASVIILAVGTGEAQRSQADAEKLAKSLSSTASAKPDDRILFKELVEKNSSDPITKAAGGDVRYLSRDDVMARFGVAAADWLFADGQGVNGVSGPIEIKFGEGTAVAVFKRTGQRKAIARTFEQVKNQIRNVVYREKRSAAFDTFVGSLKTKHKVTVDESKITKIKVDATVGALPNDGHGHGGHGLPGGHMPIPASGDADIDVDDDGHAEEDGENG